MKIVSWHPKIIKNTKWECFLQNVMIRMVSEMEGGGHEIVKDIRGVHFITKEQIG